MFFFLIFCSTWTWILYHGGMIWLSNLIVKKNRWQGGSWLLGHIPSNEVDRFSASLRKWGGRTNPWKRSNWTSQPLFAENSHWGHHVGHIFGLCYTKTDSFWWQREFLSITQRAITAKVSTPNLGLNSVHGFLILVTWISQILVLNFFTAVLYNLVKLTWNGHEGW